MRRIAELQSLEHRVALVAGGAGHVALAAEEALLELGASVVLLDAEEDACQARKELLVSKGVEADRIGFLKVDLSDDAQARAAVRATAEDRGRLDVVVHTAAFVGTTAHPGWAVPFSEQTSTAFEAALRVNLTSAFSMAQEARPFLETTGHGSIVFVSSIYGIVGPDMSLYSGTSMANPVGYGASKAGLLQLTRSLATSFAPSIRVNAISPGGIARGQPGAFVERYVRRTPMARMAIEEDLKGAFAFLCSDLSAYLTGQNLVVDGGFTAW